MRFYLGTHRPHWLGLTDVPLFVSRRTLAGRATFPRASGPWALDSGGYTELAGTGRWSVSVADYAEEVLLYAAEVGRLDFAAPMDWMCEPSIRERTGLTVEQHQRNTCANFDYLRYRLGDLVVPVLQGWEPDDYLRHVEMYGRYRVNLDAEPVVGVGSVCRRHADGSILKALRPLLGLGLSLHAFGVRGDVLRAVHDQLGSADSMAWSFDARYASPLRGCTHARCANCLRYALRWRERLLKSCEQLSMEVR